MAYKPNWSNSGKSLEKRKSTQHNADPLKRGPFQLTPAFVKFVETNVFNRKTPLSKPKSMYRHGLRVLFAECDQYLVFDIAKLAQETYVKHTAAHSRIDKGYFDFAFASATDADEAALIPLKINNRFVPTIRTRYAKDTNLFIGFEELPCTIQRNQLLNHLLEGLQCYGEVLELELNRDPLFQNSSSSRGYAIINPLPNVNENIALIPRVAHFIDGQFSSTSFRVIPERSPPVCVQCQCIGHTKNACPNNLLNLLKKKSESEPTIEDDPMGDEVDGDLFLDSPSECESIYSSDISESYTWGDLASYKIVEPTTREQRREAHIAAKEKITPIEENTILNSIKDSNEKLNLFQKPTPQLLVNIQKENQEKIVQTAQTETNPFGETTDNNNKKPRGRPPKPTTEGPQKPRNPVGRPKKGPFDPQSFSTLKDQIHNQYPTTSSNQNTNDKAYASHQYIKEAVFYDPPANDLATRPEEHHNNGASSRQ